MKRSKPWLMLIAIASALLVSAATSARGAGSHQQTEGQTESRETQPKNEQSSPYTTPTTSQHATSTSDTSSSKPTTDDASQTSYWAYWHILTNALSSQQFFNAILTVATIFIAVFNYQLLFLDRPILVVDRPTPKWLSPREREEARAAGAVFLISGALCPFRNVGKSPAIVLRVVAKMKLHYDLPLPPSFNDCDENTARKEAVVPAATASDFRTFYSNPAGLSEDDWKIVSEGAMKLVLYGQITYRGVLWKKYTACFGFIYEPPDSGFGKGNVFRFGRREYNTLS